MAKNLFYVTMGDNGDCRLTQDGRRLHTDEVFPLIKEGCSGYEVGSEGVIVYLTKEEVTNLNLQESQS